MKRLAAGALLIAMSGAPTFAQAATEQTPPAAAGQMPGRSPAPAVAAERPSATTDYAAREAATPELGKFTGGGAGIYIGGSTLVVVLLVVLIVILI